MEKANQEAVNSLELVHNIRINDPNAPLVIAVHGRGGNVEVMSAFKSRIPEDFNIIAPEAPNPDLKINGFSWWDIEDEQNKRDNINSAYEILLYFIEESIKYYELKPKLILAIGFSQGAGILSKVLQKNSDLFSGLALISGFVIKENSKLNTYPKIFMSHGEKDEIITFKQALESRDHLKSLGLDVEFNSDDMGHKIGSENMKKLKAWFLSFK